MILHVFHFDMYKKTVVHETVEVEEKPKTYKVIGNGVIPFLYISKILKEDLEKVTRQLSYVSTVNDPVKAVRAFRKYWSGKYDDAKRAADQYDDYYRSCFTYADENGVSQIP